MTVPTPPPHPSPRNLLRKKHVLQTLQVSDVTIWHWIRQGNFPAPFQLNPGQYNSPVAWYEHEIDAWIARRAEMRGDPQQAPQLVGSRYWLGPTASGMYRTKLP